MAYSTIRVERRGGTAWLTLARPQAMNAINLEMMDELTAALAGVERDDGVRALVLTGEGRAFCAGGDLSDLLEGLAPKSDGSLDFLDRSGAMYTRLRNLPKPVVGALNGLTLAGGLELALCCDVLFAADGVKIGDAHANFGVFPGAGGAAVLPKRIGLNNAKHLLFSGQTLPAAHFLASGFISRVVPPEQLNDIVMEFVEVLATKSPIALRRMKEVANAAMDRSVEDALRHELLTLRQHLRSYDMSEGLAAFREKRKPDFKGY